MKPETLSTLLFFSLIFAYVLILRFNLEDYAADISAFLARVDWWSHPSAQ